VVYTFDEATSRGDLEMLWPDPCERCHLVNGTVGGAEDGAEQSGCTCVLTHENPSLQGPTASSEWVRIFYMDIHHRCIYEKKDGSPAFAQRRGLLLKPTWYQYGQDGQTACKVLAEALGKRTLVLAGDSLMNQFSKMIKLRCSGLKQAQGLPSVFFKAPIALDAGPTVWADDTRMGWDEWEHSVGEFFASDDSLVLFVSFGLHFTNATEYRRVMQHYLRAMNGALMQGAKGILLGDTTTQHFATSTGGYHQPELINSTSRSIDGYACTPSELLTGPNWRNAIVEELVATAAANTSERRVPLLRLGEMTRQFYDSHPGGKVRGRDCTHFCYTPGLIDGFIHEIAALLQSPPPPAPPR
jgi:hypothetical protein